MIYIQTYNDNSYIYSVDMMHAYINIYNPSYTKVRVSDYQHILKMNVWGTLSQKYSPISAIIKHKSSEINRINKSNLKYPIIVWRNYIIDGVHRLTKAYNNGKSHINAYIFDDKLMKKFRVCRLTNRIKLNNMKIHDYIKLFYKRFII